MTGPVFNLVERFGNMSRDFVNGVINFLCTEISSVGLPGTPVSSFTVLELMFGAALPLFFGYVLVKWILDIVL